jgi:hypothetical protein
MARLYRDPDLEPHNVSDGRTKRIRGIKHLANPPTAYDKRLKNGAKNKYSGIPKPEGVKMTKDDKRFARRQFLIELKDCGIPSVASRRVGVSPGTMHKWRKTMPDFNEKVEAVLDEFVDSLECVAVERAREKSDSLLAMLLRANRPEKYHDRTRMDMNANVNEKTQGTVSIVFSQDEVGEADKDGGVQNS